MKIESIDLKRRLVQVKGWGEMVPFKLISTRKDPVLKCDACPTKGAGVHQAEILAAGATLKLILCSRCLVEITNGECPTH